MAPAAAASPDPRRVRDGRARAGRAAPHPAAPWAERPARRWRGVARVKRAAAAPWPPRDAPPASGAHRPAPAHPRKRISPALLAPPRAARGPGRPRPGGGRESSVPRCWCRRSGCCARAPGATRWPGATQRPRARCLLGPGRSARSDRPRPSPARVPATGRETGPTPGPRPGVLSGRRLRAASAAPSWARSIVADPDSRPRRGRGRGMKDALLDDEGRRAVVAATLVSALLVAQQTAGRATRDALFLSTFPVAFLPAVMMASAAASVLAVGALSWALARRSPFRVLPVAAGLSSVLLLLEWLLCLAAPKVAAVAVYLHLSLFGGTLLSGFWSLVNERFDPYTAKEVVGRIGFGASVGGVAGGIMAWGASRLIPVPSMLLVMALLTLAAMAGMVGLGRHHVAASSLAPPAAPGAPSALSTLRRVPYLRDL